MGLPVLRSKQAISTDTVLYLHLFSSYIVMSVYDIDTKYYSSLRRYNSCEPLAPNTSLFVSMKINTTFKRHK